MAGTGFGADKSVCSQINQTCKLLADRCGFVVVAVLAFNFLGDGMRDAADPYGH